MGLILSLDNSIHSFNTGKFVLDQYTGAAAAYSLRMLSVNTTDVVRVRRSVDNAEADFTADEITDGTMTAWVNASMPLPLDTATAAAAYSLRNLKTSYTGSVIRVRRSSDNAEADFTADEITDGTLTSFVGGQNLLLQSENLNTKWLPSNTTPTQSTETTPDGDSTNKYIKLVDDSSGGTGVCWIQQDLTLSANTTYTASVYLKADQLSFASLRIFQYDGSTSGDQYFGLSGSGSLGAGTGLDNSNIEAYPNGWYRCSITWTQGVSDTNSVLLIRLASSISSVTVPRDGTSSIFVWGAQVNEGATAGDYAPTTSNVSGYGYVTTWYDQAGSNDATQATAASQPKIVDAGLLVEENGKPAVSFDGSDDQFTAANLEGLSRLDIFRVHKQISSQFVLLSESTSLVERGFTGSQGQVTSGLPNNFGSPSLYKNGVLQSISTRDDVYNAFLNQNIHSVIDADTTTWSDFAIGGTSTFIFQGTIQEFIAYNSDQSSNRELIETNINDYYSIYAQDRDGFVTTWYDQSGNSNDATQATASSQPKIVNAGVLVEENGKPAVSFDGVDDFIETANGVSNSENTVIAVFNDYEDRNFRYFYDGNTLAEMMLGTSTSEDVYRYSSGGVGTFSNLNGTFSDPIDILSFAVHGTTSSIAINGAVNRSGDSKSNPNAGKLSLGQGTDYGLNAKVKYWEFIIYPSDESANRTTIETNINDYYSIYP